MTKFQEKQLKLFGSDKICVDSTHGTTGYDFLLTTLMVVDEFGEGVPTAFLLSNRADTNVLAYFFNSIKEQTGDIKCNVFMSDDAPEFFNAWTNIMSKPENHLLCAWHIDRNWRKNLNKIKGDQAMKAKVYKYLRLLLQSTDPADFEDMLNFVLSELLACEDTAAFGQYFQSYYAGRCNLWAYCYRKGLGINTNMYLEALHRTLKHVYFQGKKNKRVDTCLYALLNLVRDIVIKKLKKKVKGNNSHRMNLIKKAHVRSQDIKFKDICKIDENNYKIKSIQNNTEYHVQKVDECLKINKNCHIFCSECKTCIHEFTCTCVDFFIKSNFCKHIHAVIRNNLQTLKPIQKTETETDDIIQTVVNENIIKKGDCENQDLKVKLDIMYELISSKKLTSDVKLKVGKMMDNILSLIGNETKTLKDVYNEPGNKKYEKQVRFVSTKKKQTPKSEDLLQKPSTSGMKSLLEDCENKIRENDHLYTKEIGIFMNK
uniref:Uncharacterized protein LOC114346433 n=1 Tax=Diabrotica virgifera virgifera TaxID=50390 RepID=A0A6P7HAU8_DIAVI